MAASSASRVTRRAPTRRPCALQRRCDVRVKTGPGIGGRVENWVPSPRKLRQIFGNRACRANSWPRARPACFWRAFGPLICSPVLPVDDEPGRWDGQEDSKSVAGLDGHLGADLGVVGRVGATSRRKRIRLCVCAVMG